MSLEISKQEAFPCSGTRTARMDFRLVLSGRLEMLQ
jgi:hypothetical protein